MAALLRLAPGDRVEYGLATLDYRVDGVLEACDPYGCSRYRLHGGIVVEAYPAYPVHRPSRVADCVYVELEEELVVTPGSRLTLYTVAPFDVELRASTVVLSRLAPVKVKYTVVGDVVDGYLCRYYRGRAALSPSELSPGPGEALVAAVVRGSGVLRGIGFSLDMVRLFVGETVSYTRLEVEVGQHTVTVRATGKPSAPGEPSPATQRRVVPTSFTYPA